jgi:hypothetical protein
MSLFECELKKEVDRDVTDRQSGLEVLLMFVLVWTVDSRCPAQRRSSFAVVSFLKRCTLAKTRRSRLCSLSRNCMASRNSSAADVKLARSAALGSRLSSPMSNLCSNSINLSLQSRCWVCGKAFLPQRRMRPPMSRYPNRIQRPHRHAAESTRLLHVQVLRASFRHRANNAKHQVVVEIVSGLV